MAFPRYVGLRLSDQPGVVPLNTEIQEGDLAINTADGRVFILAGATVVEITDNYSQTKIDNLLNLKADISSLSDVATSGKYSDLSGLPSLGTAAPLDVPTSGDAAASEVVKGDDSRLSDARAPTAHTHPWSEVTDKPTTYPPSQHSHTLSEITDAGTAASKDASEFDAAGSAVSAVSYHEALLDPHPQYVLDVVGKGLSTEDYTTTEKNKLAGVESGATADQTKADIDALGVDADTVDGKHASDFDPAGSAAQVENDIRDTLRKAPDPILMYFL